MGKNELIKKINDFINCRLNELKNDEKKLLEDYSILEGQIPYVIEISSEGKTFKINCDENEERKGFFNKFNFSFNKSVKKFVIERAKKEILSNVKECQRMIKKMEDVRLSMDKFLTTGVINIPDFFHKMIPVSLAVSLTVEDYALLLGIVIRKNYSLYYRNKQLQQKIINSQDKIAIDEMNICLSIGDYFDKSGNIIPHDDIVFFKNSLDNIFDGSLVNSKPIKDLLREEKLPTISDIIKVLIDDLTLKNQQFKEKCVAKQAEETLRKENIKLEKKAFLDSKLALEEFATYFRNGVVLKKYEDESSFIELLNRCNFSEEYKAKIMRLMNLNLEKTTSAKVNLPPFLAREEKELIILAKENLPINNTFLQEVSAIIEMIDQTAQKEEIDILKAYLDEALINLKAVMDIPDNNFSFKKIS